jgi:hypothetical protein
MHASNEFVTFPGLILDLVKCRGKFPTAAARRTGNR